MVKIGDFARLCRVSIKTLRHYQEVGLFHPRHIDPHTGYRYYSASQLPLLNQILVFRGLGFSVEATREMTRSGFSASATRDALLARRVELKDRIAAEQQQLAEIEARLKQIEIAAIAGAQVQVFLKDTEAAWVASKHRTLNGYDELETLLSDLRDAIGNPDTILHTGAIWHRCSWDPCDDLDCEALAFLREQVPKMANVRSYELPSIRAASATHRAENDPFPHVHAAVLNLLDAGRLAIAGPLRESYFSRDGIEWIELLYPVQPIEMELSS